MKIIIFSTMNSGGAEKVSESFAEILCSSGHEVDLVIAGPHFKGQSERNYNFKYLKIKRYKTSFLKFFLFLRKNKCDVVFTSLHGLATPLILAWLLLQNKPKLIVRQSFMPNRFSQWSLKSIEIRLLYRLIDRIISQTNDMKSMMVDYYSLSPTKITVAQNPLKEKDLNSVSVSHNPFKEYKGYIFVSIGNVRPVKGHDVLINAFNIVKKNLPNSHLFILGDCSIHKDYYSVLLNLIDKFHLSDCIHFTGFITETTNYLLNSDCFVLSSRSEGLPNVLLEALYLKKRVVATKCIPIISSLIEDGRNGFTVEIDDVSGMAEALEKSVKMNFSHINRYIPASNDEILNIFLEWKE